jgi:hypothetical protein
MTQQDNARRQANRDDAAWEKWCVSFDAAREEIQTLFHTRWMWRTIIGMLRHSRVPQDPYVQQYLLRTYVATVCTAIRREADRDSRTTSLARCLERLVERPTLISRTRYRALTTARGNVQTDALADEMFDRFASAGVELLDPALVTARLDALHLAVEPIKKYTDRVIAHREAGQADAINFEQINHALQELGGVNAHYFSLRFPGISTATVSPIMGFKFLDMFKQPWYRDGYQPPDWRDLDDP